MVQVLHLNAFAATPHMVNPAGVVLATERLSDAAMQKVALAVRFNETAFVLPLAVTDVRIRYFTPGHEVNLCGHATVAAFIALHRLGLFGREVPCQLTLESRAGLLPVAAADFVPDLPVVYGSTGLWTLVVPVRTLAAVRRMAPRNAAFPGVLAEMPGVSVHPFCLETIDPAAHIHARHFSSPRSGTVEDPVTKSPPAQLLKV